MEVVGRVCRVYYPWKTSREEIRIAGLPVVVFPVYAKKKRKEKNNGVLLEYSYCMSYSAES